MHARTCGLETALVPERGGERYSGAFRDFTSKFNDPLHGLPPPLLPALLPDVSSISPTVSMGESLGSLRSLQDSQLLSCRKAVDACSRRLRALDVPLSKEMMFRRLESAVRDGIRRKMSESASEASDTCSDNLDAPEGKNGASPHTDLPELSAATREELVSRVNAMSLEVADIDFRRMLVVAGRAGGSGLVGPASAK